MKAEENTTSKERQIGFQHEASFSCYVKNYCDVPVGWIKDLQTGIQKSFIGFDQVVAAYREVLSEYKYYQKILVYFCNEGATDISISASNPNISKIGIGCVDDLVAVIAAQIGVSNMKVNCQLQEKI